jgi:predicted transposase YdaD
VTRTPHDALFHFAFSRAENAAGELRSVLPPALASRIDWSTLTLTDGHYVDEDLSSRQSDLLFTACLEHQPIGLYLLFEHQSAPETFMPLRMLRYAVRILDRWLADNPGATTLPVVVPVLLSHAEGGWRAATSMGELYALTPELSNAVGPHVPQIELVLDDLTRHTDQELRDRAMSALGSVALGLLRWSRSGSELLVHLAEYADAFQAMWRAPDGREALATVFRYLALARGPVTLQDLTGTFMGLVDEEAREVVMTEAQMEIERWLAQGEAKGEAKGRAVGRAEALVAMLTARGLPLSEDLRARILGCTDIATLDRWIVRAATASSAADALSET